MSKAKRLYSFLHSLAKKRDFPGVVNLDITAKCNLSCEHCYQKKNSTQIKEFSDSEWEKIFKDFHNKGVKNVFLTGGEPALRMDVIRSAYNIFNSTTIVSNGTIPFPDDIQTRLFISVDGPREIHDEIRGARIFDTVMNNIKNDKRVVLTPTISKTNFRYINDLIRITREAKVDGITFSTYTSHNKKDDPLLLNEEEMSLTIESLKREWKANKDIVFLSPGILKQFEKKDFHKSCYLQNRSNEISYDSQLHQKEPCVLGAGVDCSTCGCIVPIIAYAMSRADIQAWLVFDRLYAERYYR